MASYCPGDQDWAERPPAASACLACGATAAQANPLPLHPTSGNRGGDSRARVPVKPEPTPISSERGRILTRRSAVSPIEGSTGSNQGGLGGGEGGIGSMGGEGTSTLDAIMAAEGGLKSVRGPREAAEAARDRARVEEARAAAAV
eukprot:scaffold11917_cov128-Isochrysis_galbana.AAC.9